MCAIDHSVNVAPAGQPQNLQPAACTKPTNNSTLNGHDDWTAIRLNFRQFGDSASGAINKITEREQTLAEMLAQREELNVTSELVQVRADSTYGDASREGQATGNSRGGEE